MVNNSIHNKSNPNVKAKMHGRVGFGNSPAILIIDLINSQTDESYPMGSNLDSVIDNINRLLKVSREKKLPVIFFRHAYQPNLKDLGILGKKMRTVDTLIDGTVLTEIDDRLKVEPE